MATAPTAEIRRLQAEVAVLEEKVEILRVALLAAMNQGVEMTVYEYKDRWADPSMVSAEHEAGVRDEAEGLMAMKVARECLPWTHPNGNNVPSDEAKSVLEDLVWSRDGSYEGFASSQRGEMARRQWSPLHFGAYLRARLVDMRVAHLEPRNKGDYKSYNPRRHYLRELAELEVRLEGLEEGRG